jgi:hypothetical protein
LNEHDAVVALLNQKMADKARWIEEMFWVYIVLSY